MCVYLNEGECVLFGIDVRIEFQVNLIANPC